MNHSLRPMPAASRIRRNRAPADDLRLLSDPQLLQRYARDHDDDTFAILVERHGPMVLRVCRNILSETYDAEDAVQASFLVLLRKAKSIRKQQSVASWLYKVAYRIALEARGDSARRKTRESRTAGKVSPDPLVEITGRELLGALDEELVRLPEKYRAPLVLCYLESATIDEAARHLDWSPSTVKRRLDSGRDLLRTRLARRGLTLSAALATILLGAHQAGAVVPHRALQPEALVGASARVTALADSAFKVSFLTRLTVLVLLGIGMSGALSPSPRGYTPVETAPMPAPTVQEEKPQPSVPPVKAVDNGNPMHPDSSANSVPMEPPDFVLTDPSSYWCSQVRPLPSQQ
ncbi:MAG: sigma-70 family RNA polymerase sigma factor [Gemmataceae bacterium]|nr:sigma-70 family RNA polymerase sigma factor [Gemmataceae bacterium]